MIICFFLFFFFLKITIVIATKIIKSYETSRLVCLIIFSHFNIGPDFSNYNPLVRVKSIRNHFLRYTKIFFLKFRKFVYYTRRWKQNRRWIICGNRTIILWDNLYYKDIFCLYSILDFVFKTTNDAYPPKYLLLRVS